jgi:hypothetical protein
MSGLFGAAPVAAGPDGLRDRRSTQYIGLALARVPGRIRLRSRSQPVAITSIHPRTLRCPLDMFSAPGLARRRFRRAVRLASFHQADRIPGEFRGQRIPGTEFRGQYTNLMHHPPPEFRGQYTNLMHHPPPNSLK